MVNRGMWVLAYVDDVVVMVTGPFICVVVEVLEKIMGEIRTRVISCGLGVKLYKTSLILFANMR